MPDVLKNSSIEVFESKLNEHEYIKSLQNKLLEESQEVINATEKEVCEELAYVFEVINAIAKFYSIDFSEIIKTAENKREEKGGYENKHYINFIKISDDNVTFNYYKNGQKYYPQID